jgi:hypothetical protein
MGADMRIRMKTIAATGVAGVAIAGGFATAPRVGDVDFLYGAACLAIGVGLLVATGAGAVRRRRGLRPRSVAGVR